MSANIMNLIKHRGHLGVSTAINLQNPLATFTIGADMLAGAVNTYTPAGCHGARTPPGRAARPAAPGPTPAT